MKRAWTYLRVSSQGQTRRAESEEGYSIETQRARTREKAVQLEALPEQEYLDMAESARSADRPALKRLLADLKQRPPDYVIVHKLDRLARNRLDDVQIVAAIRAAGAQLVSVTENIDETPTGGLLHGIIATVAEFYSANLANEVVTKSTQKAQLGGTIGRAPLGYRNVRQSVDGREIRTVETDPERVPLIQWAFSAYATGQHTLDTLVDDLTEKGLRTKPNRRYSAKPLSRSYLATLLQNRYYIGRVRYRGVEYDGRHEPIIDADTFSRVQEVLKAHTVSGEKDRKHRHYLKGTVYCRCGSRLCLTKAKGTYLYFFCVGRHQRRNDCTQRYVAAERIEDAVAAHWQRLQLTPETVEQIRQWLIPTIQRMCAGREKEAERARRRRARLETERNTLVRSHLANPVAVPLDQLETEQRRLNKELTDAEQAIAAAETEVVHVTRAAEEALDLLGDLGRAYRLSNDRTRRVFNQAFFERIELEGDGDVIEAPYAEDAWDHFEILAREARGRATRQAVSVAFSGAGSKESAVVGGAGFEPA